MACPAENSPANRSTMPAKPFIFICGPDDFLVNRPGKERYDALAAEATDEFSREVLNGLASWLSEKGFSLRGLAPSRLKGPKGNVEFFMLIERGTDKRASPADIAEAVRRADAI